MRKVLYLTFCLVLLLNFDDVKAAKCSDDEIAKLKGLAAGVSYNAEFIGDSDDAETVQDYSVSFIGLTNEIYISDSEYSFFVTNDSKKIVLSSGINYLEIYSRNCNYQRLKSIKIELPRFNEYSLSDYCDDRIYKELDVCDPWYTGKLNDEEFDRIIEEYNNKLNEENGSIIDDIKEFVYTHLLIVGGIVVAFVVIIVTVIVIRSRKNRLD